MSWLRPKVNFYDRYLWIKFLKVFSFISLCVSTFLLFNTIPDNYKTNLGISFLVLMIVVFIWLWYKANMVKHININVDSTNIEIKEGNLFKQEGLITIGFNEYFDTIVDDKIIAKRSLNGMFILNHLEKTIQELDNLIQDEIEDDQKLRLKEHKGDGKSQRYKLGTVFLLDDKYILTAFTKFNDRNEAKLSMPEYLEFLVNFWDRVNSIYAQRSISVPIFGSGITRIKERKDITDEELLKIMLWTFKISEMRFKHPAKLTIVIHSDKIKAINLHDIKGLGDGL